jgi:hypothetical protein
VTVNDNHFSKELSMRREKSLPWVLALCIAGGIGAPAGASTFARVGLDYLVAENGMIVVGEVLGTRSYWNDPGTLILTEVQVSVSEVLKGRVAGHEITVTLPGGTVGDETVAVIGGAELIPGKSYVLFLQKGDLPGAGGVYVVRDHSQGVFDVQMGKDGLRAVSQATHMELVSDGFGNVTAPGGAPGMPFQSMRRSIRELAARGAGRKEVE